jgi:hypothetical protein
MIFTMGLNFLENIFTYHTSMTEETVVEKWKALKASKKDVKKCDELVKELRRNYHDLIQYTPGKRYMLTSAVIRMMDQEYIDKLASKASFLGSHHKAYGSALSTYHDGIKDILQQVIEQHTNDMLPEVRETIPFMLGKLQLYMTRIDDFELSRLPLMTPSVIMSIASVWSKHNYAIREVSGDFIRLDTIFYSIYSIHFELYLIFLRLTV